MLASNLILSTSFIGCGRIGRIGRVYSDLISMVADVRPGNGNLYCISSGFNVHCITVAFDTEYMTINNLKWMKNWSKANSYQVTFLGTYP